MSAPTLEEKRELVTDWLDGICAGIEACATAHDPYPCPDDEIQTMLKGTDGLIAYIKYAPYTLEWMAFAPEGWLFSRPTDAQVEKMYPIALQESEAWR